MAGNAGAASVNAIDGFDLRPWQKALEEASSIRLLGRVNQVIGLTIESVGPQVRMGELCYLESAGGELIEAEVVGFRQNYVLLMPLGDMEGVAPGATVRGTGTSLQVQVGESLLGRVLDGLGRPMDGKGPLRGTKPYPVTNQPPHPLARRRITEPLEMGVRAIDGILTCGRGQRVGIFSGSGVGKSTLLGMIARNTAADINVIALVGERGREVREFLEKDLGEDGLARSVVVVATSDQRSLQRVKAAMVATAIAEYFRDQGEDVMLMMDSVTRFAIAQREIGLATGEPPTTRGFTPSVFAMLPRLLERAGMGSSGSITALYTVLVEGDDMTEPVADTVRATLDGHIVLTRELAAENHFPSIDLLQSASRVMVDIVPDEHVQAANWVREMIAIYRKNRDLVNIGAYVPGSNRQLDQALGQMDTINGFLRQGIREVSPYQESVTGVLNMYHAAAGTQSPGGR